MSKLSATVPQSYESIACRGELLARTHGAALGVGRNSKKAVAVLLTSINRIDSKLRQLTKLLAPASLVPKIAKESEAVEQFHFIRGQLHIAREYLA